MVALGKDVLELIKRREESFASAFEKIEHILDFTKMYKMNQNTEMMKMVIQDLKSNVKTQQVLDGQQTKVVRYFEHTIPKEFIKDTVSLCEDVYNNIITKEVNDFKKDIKKIADFAEEDIRKFDNSINDVVYLYSLSKEKDMESDIYKIEQGLTACLKYNDKIEKEMSYE